MSPSRRRGRSPGSGTGLRRSHTGLQPSHQPETPRGTLGELVRSLYLLLLHERDPQSRGEKTFGAAELRARNPKHVEGMFVQLHRTSYNRRIGREMITPVGIAQHDVRTAVGTVLIGLVKEATKVRLDTQRIEIICAGFIEPYLRRVATRGQARRGEIKREHTIKAPIPVADILVIGVRVERLVPLLDGVEAFCIRHIEGVQNQRVQHAEDHSVGPDAQRQSENGRDGEAG